MAELLKMI